MSTDLFIHAPDATLPADALALANDRSVVLAHFAATMDDGDRAVLARLMRRK